MYNNQMQDLISFNFFKINQLKRFIKKNINTKCKDNKNNALHSVQ